MKLVHRIPSFGEKLPEAIKLPAEEPDRSEWSSAARRIMGWKSNSEITGSQVTRWNRFFTLVNGEMPVEDWKEDNIKRSVELIAQKVSYLTKGEGISSDPAQDLIQIKLIKRIQENRGTLNKEDALKSDTLNMYLNALKNTFLSFVSKSTGVLYQKYHESLDIADITEIIVEKMDDVFLAANLRVENIKSIRNMLFDAANNRIVDE